MRGTIPTNIICFSICLWGSADVRAWGKDPGGISRTSEDISPIWGRLLHNLDSVSGRSLYAHPGAWNDPDMLYIGSGDFDEHHMTEARSHFALWAMENAPLIIGYDLRKASPALTDLWTGERSRFRKERRFTAPRARRCSSPPAGRGNWRTGVYLSERPGSVNPAVDGVETPQPDPLVHRAPSGWTGTHGSGDFPRYGGWGGARVDRQRDVTFLVYGDGRLLARSRPARTGRRHRR